MNDSTHANQPEGSQLGKASAYADRYDPGLLYPLPRAPKRQEIGIQGGLPFMGADLWTGYELSWLNRRGKPQVAIMHLTVPCETPHIVESKSLKLYLNSFNHSVFDDAQAVQERLRADLSEAVWRSHPSPGKVGVRLVTPAQFPMEQVHELDGLSLDRLDVECTHYSPAPELLCADPSQGVVEEVLVSDLLKSNCLVTGQPDWGSVRIAYAGAPIDQAGLLRYLVSFRNHNEFHEQCVERIYMDIMSRCRPTRLSVYARYTRRGGLDINPWRSSHPQLPPANVRTARQ
jgi:7-cyano-7-deazaguanine reductase